MRQSQTRHLVSTVKKILATCIFLFATSAGAQNTSLCDLNADGQINIVDVQLATNMALGLVPCTASVVAAGVCDLTVVQRVTNAALGQTCVTGLVSAHSVA